MAKKPTRTTIHISGALEKALGANPHSISGRLAVIGDRYTEILRRQRIKPKFDDDEINALRDIIGDTRFEPARLIDGAMRALLEDALRDGWEPGIDIAILAQKLEALTYTEQVALVEDLEQYLKGPA